MGIARLTRSGSRTWCNEDAPIEFRARKGLCTDIKRMLIDEWGYGIFEPWIDYADLTLSINKEFVLQPTYDDGQIVLHYGDGWEEFLEPANLQQFIDTAMEKSQCHRKGKVKKAVKQVVINMGKKEYNGAQGTLAEMFHQYIRIQLQSIQSGEAHFNKIEHRQI